MHEAGVGACVVDDDGRVDGGEVVVITTVDVGRDEVVVGLVDPPAACFAGLPHAPRSTPVRIATSTANKGRPMGETEVWWEVSGCPSLR